MNLSGDGLIKLSLPAWEERVEAHNRIMNSRFENSYIWSDEFKDGNYNIPVQFVALYVKLGYEVQAIIFN